MKSKGIVPISAVLAARAPAAVRTHAGGGLLSRSAAASEPATAARRRRTREGCAARMVSPRRGLQLKRHCGASPDFHQDRK
eukprot:scaffold1376_cov257-Pinguiococcus_pyrenoidosus.AAC.15